MGELISFTLFDWLDCFINSVKTYRPTIYKERNKNECITELEIISRQSILKVA